MSKNTLRFVVFAGLFAVPFIPFLVSSSLFFPFITTKTFTFEIISEIVFAAWLLLALLDIRYRPKRSLILTLLVVFLAIVGLADILGVAPVRSIWSNFERMEGYVLLLHMGAFFLIISSTFRELEWKRWWNTSLAASFLMVLYSFLQIAGVKTINQGGVRVDGTFGNAIYLAVYLLFHIFIAFLFMVREWPRKGLRWTYGFLILLQIVVLYYTATRGTILGLLGGLVIFALLNLRNRENPSIKKASVGVLAALVVLVGGFFAVRNASFVQKSPVLSRFATLSFSELTTQGRYYIWPMALKGIAERPILGWGQENFSYVFQKHYSSEMYNLEPWFDRAHNVFLDWAIAGGLLALIAYLGFYAAAVYIIWKKDTLPYVEKTILLSLLAAYFFHNLFVFDHLFSYILFFSVLAYVHSRNAGAPVWQRDAAPGEINGLFLPAIGVLLAVSLYYVEWKPLSANAALIQGLQYASAAPTQAIAGFEHSYEEGPLGRQEEVEQMTVAAPAILGNAGVPIEQRNQFFVFANNAVHAELAKLPDDARLNLIGGMFLVGTGSTQEGLKYLEHAKELAPAKQDIYFQLGSADFVANKPQDALEAFREAYELEPKDQHAKDLYLVAAIYVGDSAVERQLRSTYTERDLAFNDTILSAYYTVKRYGNVAELLNERKQLDPRNAATYDSYLKQLSK